MPSLAIFVHTLGPTGVALNAIAIARHMAAAGWDVSLLTCKAPDAFEPPVGVRIVTFRAEGSRDVALLLAVQGLRRWLRREQPRLTLSAGNHAHLAVWAASRGLRLPVAYRISNDLAHDRGRSAASLFRGGKLRLIARDAAALVLVSANLRCSPAMRSASTRTRIVTIPNGVDVAEVRRRMREPCPHPWLNEEGSVVLAVGRLAAQKNFPALLRALVMVRREKAVRLVVLGDGSQAEHRGLISLASGLGLTDAVDFTGTTPNPFAYLARADVLALPSLWEGSSNVLLEALACGTPVVASRTAGSAEVVLDGGRFGRLIDPLDEEDLARAILDQLDPATRVPPGGRAAAYDRGEAMSAYEAVFTELVVRT